MFRSIAVFGLLSATLLVSPELVASSQRSAIHWHPAFQTSLDAAKKFNIQKILKVVNEKNSDGSYKVQGVETLLQTPLFQNLDSFEVSSVLMRESRALFRGAANRELPRVINTAGTTAFAYYTDPKHSRAFHSLEVIDTNPETAEINFYLIEYAAGRPRVVKNQANCVNCHRRRHNWAIYRLWPGIEMDNTLQGHLREPANISDIGITMDIWEMNMARISRQVLSDVGYRKSEKKVIAALLDCPVEAFGLEENAAYQTLEKDTFEEYYKDAITLIEDVNQTNDEDITYERLADGRMAFRTLLNQEDPRRLALVRYFLRQGGSTLNDREWSTSRRPSKDSILFQASGGLGLNRLAYYLIHNSSNREALAALVPDSAKLTHGARSETSAEICSALIAD